LGQEVFDQLAQDIGSCEEQRHLLTMLDFDHNTHSMNKQVSYQILQIVEIKLPYSLISLLLYCA